MTRGIRRKAVWGTCWVVLALAPSVRAQGTSSPPPPPSPQEEGVFDPAQPDFTVISMPTTLRLPTHRGAFRLTHRFGRPLGQGNVGDLVADLFGLDSGAQVGLEFRFAPARGVQAGIHRTNDKTIAFFGQVGLRRAGPGTPIALDGVVAVEGTNNFRDEYSPSLGVVMSTRLASRGGLYLLPRWVHHVNPSPAPGEDEDTLVMGVGGRLRLGASVYLVGEVAPRLAGYAPGVAYGSFGVEKRVGGHVFQLNVSNALGTTPVQIARGGYRREDWFIGFNLTRKFF